MSILASLTRAYDRLALRHEVPAFGFSSEKIGFVISLNPDGSMAGPPIDWRDKSGKKPTSRLVSVPASFKRPGVTPRSFFLWDNTSFCLGVTASEGRDASTRLAAFRELHLKALSQTHDEGLRAFVRFIETWRPEMFSELGWPEDMKDQNVVFALESERHQRFMHDRPEAHLIWNKISSEGEKTEAICLVTGVSQPIARLHQAIKGVWGAQVAGASIVSFNLDAFTSYGHEQGDNAPVSEAAAFAYTTALNRFLEKGSENRLQIGDASVVFWADASDAKVAETAEKTFLAFFSDADEAAESRTRIRPILEKIRQGVPVQSFFPQLAQGVRFHVLGLAPNAARLSIRFWFEDDFGVLAKNYQRYMADMRIEPPDRDENVPLWKYLREMAVLGKSENVPSILAGEWMRSILTGTNYPLTLLSMTLMRIRADGDVNARRVSILKALLSRNFNLNPQEAPVAFDPDNRNKGYLLGRLFAVYEHIQAAALGRNVNATIKDKFYGSASAQPRKVFALLDKGSANHLSKIGKAKPRYRGFWEKQVGDILALMSPSEDPFPTALSSQEQALFGLGYYHQRNEFFKTKSPESTPSEDASL